jgi:hypothetical protein
MWSLQMRRRQEPKLLLLVCVLACSAPVVAQTTNGGESQPNVTTKEPSKIREADALEAERRIFAISAVTSLANEARSYDDVALRARVLMRAADTLWTGDDVTARSLFHRAWDAAEQADGQEPVSQAKGGPPMMVRTLQRISGHDLRMEVLRLATRRDRVLGEEFLTKLKDENSREAKDAANGPGARTTDPWLVSEQMTKRLLLAKQLVADDQIELALEIATPGLNEVNAQSISFLSVLREKRPEIADQKFAMLLTSAELDPSADANTVSGLASYVLTPGFYVTYTPEGGSRWTQPDKTAPAANVPAALRYRFFKTAGNILLRPSPPPDQDFSSAGRLGKSIVIKRLLPYFDREAPETAAAIRTQLTALQADMPRRAIPEDNSNLMMGLNAEAASGDTEEKMQERIDRARTSRERDEIYADAAVALASKGIARAKDLADKIEDQTRRTQLRQFVDIYLLQHAIGKANVSEVVRLARTGQFTHPQRVWAYTQAAKLFKNAERIRAAEFLTEAAEEARRIEVESADRVRSLIGVATAFVTVDQVRAWEILGEAIKAANSTGNFTGENDQLTFGLLMTRSGVKSMNIRAADFSLAGLFHVLAEIDLNRTADLAKSFKNPAPKATAVLSVAGAVLNKKTPGLRPGMF